MQLKLNKHQYLKKILMLIFIMCTVLPLKANEDSLSNSIVAGFQADSLSNNYNQWTKYYLEYLLRDNTKFSIGFKAEDINRYNLHDKSIDLYLSTPSYLTFKWEGALNVANKGVIIPKKSIYNKLSYTNKIVNLALSVKNNTYTAGAKSDIHSLELIKYVKQLRLSYTVYKAHVKDAGNSISNKATVHYFYHKHYTAFSYASGEEVEALGNGSVLSLNVDSFTAYGQYNISKNWACNYSLNYTKQGDLYIKKGASVAAVYQF